MRAILRLGQPTLRRQRISGAGLGSARAGWRHEEGGHEFQADVTVLYGKGSDRSTHGTLGNVIAIGIWDRRTVVHRRGGQLRSTPRQTDRLH